MDDQERDSAATSGVSMQVSPSPYDAVAQAYDRHWGNEFLELAKVAFETHLLPHLDPGAVVLDLCCGTGLFLAHLEARGFRAVGVDESSKMLEIARRNAPRAQLQLSDMANFPAVAPFDAVVSFYNSVNHARSLDHMCATLANVSAHLKSQGHLLFDYMPPEAFENTWEWEEQIDGLRAQYVYDRSSGQATCLIGEEGRIRQMSFSLDQISDALRDAGLAILEECPMTRPTTGGGSRRLVLAAKQ